MFGRRPRLAHPHLVLLAALALLLLPPRAHGNFVYWTNQSPGTSIGRAKINGTALNDNFITGISDPRGVAVDSKFIYWADRFADRIGRANLDGSGVNPDFITLPPDTFPTGIAVTSSAIFYGSNGSGGFARIGRANLDGTGVDNNFASPQTPTSTCGIAADQNFVYWLDVTNKQIGRAPVGGPSASSGSAIPSFKSLPSVGCGLAVDSNYLYWGTADNRVGRVPVSGGSPSFTGPPDPTFIPSPGPGFSTTGVAVQPQYVFWANNSGTPGTNNFIGRANLDGGSPNQTLISGISNPQLMTAAPSNKITVNSITRKTKKGTAIIDAKVPGPGQVTLDQVSTPPDVNATAAAVKQIGLTVSQASSFQLAVKPVGKTAKKLKKQINKQLRKKRRAKARVKQTVFIHFVPSGVAGVPNTQQVDITLVKQRKKKK